MAMLQMQRISIYALKKDRKAVLELLQRKGVLEVDNQIEEDQVFRKMDVSYARSSFERNINAAKDASEILGRYAPEKKSILSSFEGRKVVSAEEYGGFSEKLEDALRVANRIIACNKEIGEGKAEILKLEAQREMLKPWTDLDIPLDLQGTKYTRSLIGVLPREYSLEELHQELEEWMPLHIDVISASKEQTCVFILAPKEQWEPVYEKLRRMEFAFPSVSADKAPRLQLEELRDRIVSIREEIRILEEEIRNFAGKREELYFLQDYERMRSDKYQVLGQIAQSNNVFVITGYIPQQEVGDLRGELERKFMVAIEVEAPGEEEDVPVILKNNAFAGAVESVVDGFALPAKGEIDPTALMSGFYYVLFGIMLADAGYGIIMTLACAYILFKNRKTIETGTKKFLSMFLYCGISTTFWGIMFGGYFGDMFDVIATTWFGVTDVPLIPPLWFFPVDNPMRMLAFSMALGLIHIMTGYFVKVYQLCRQRDYVAVFYDAVSWILLVASGTIILLSMEMIQNILDVSLTIPGNINTIAGAIAILSSLVIILTNGRESKNPFKRFLKGTYALYGITGVLSDVLSYSRLLALGLASGIIGNVINKMASMPAKSYGVVGVIIFIVIMLLGHTLNIAINALGAYVHTNRLQYVEFFGKFYEGGGRSFAPFTMKTKYYKVKENVNNG
ncbi:MAG TPA: V-type ATP synthase subunit I [Clostridiales bacterium]|nr:V-type ATP synthase subunit I [Clostridiales bacterium]